MHLTKREWTIIIDALSQPMGVTTKDRPLAEGLRERIILQFTPTATPPANNRTYIRSAWPQGGGSPEHKPDQFYNKPPKVSLPKTTKPAKLTVDDVLKGLL